MDMTTISGTLSSLSIAVKLVKGSIAKIKNDAVRKTVQELLDIIIPLQTHVMSLQTMYSACLEEKNRLEKKLRDNEDWDKEAARYKLHELAPEVYVYIVKNQAESSEPNHYLCQKCYNERKKSILQQTKQLHDGMHYVCASCSSEIVDHSKKSGDFHRPLKLAKCPI